MIPLISFVVITYNNNLELISTIKSINENTIIPCQIVIVNSGDDLLSLDSLTSKKHLINSIEHYFQKPCGIYPAQNYGIKKCKGKWIVILNSGDLLTCNAREILNDTFLSINDCFDILVFSQEAISNQIEYTFYPSVSSVWPHQSIVTKKAVYDKFGLYDESYKICADQEYFAVIRNIVPYKVFDTVLTQYLLGGVSNKVNLQTCIEIYKVQIKLKKSKVHALYRSFITPPFRKILEKFIGVRRLNRLKLSIYKYYSNN